ncbi:MAG: sel1 repeat family protein [Neisseriaceae bacterium]|nr:sel1 repeat family protein [Neisseriaceae bacterium]
MKLKPQQPLMLLSLLLLTACSNPLIGGVACTVGVTEGCYETALAYDSNKESKKALSYYQKAALKGHPEAQFNLAVMYNTGEGTERDESKAALWYEKAALQGHANAQYNLGVMYDRGTGVLQSYDRAIEWYEKAASQGVASASNNLGFIYSRGFNGRRDLNKAKDYFKRACSGGEKKACDNVTAMQREIDQQARHHAI